MKNLILRIAVSIFTFFAGLAFFAFVFFYFNSIPEIAPPSAPPVQKQAEKDECSETGFPGLSKPLPAIKKGKSPYFPRQIWGNDTSPKNFHAESYGRHLAAMGEKSLLDERDGAAEVYRFLWLRTFDHPLFVRLENRRNEIKLFTAELDGAGGYRPGNVLRSDEFSVSEDDFCDFLLLLEKADYWNTPVEDDSLGNDGAQWILEGVRQGRYHVVDRWTPRTGEYREACLFLLKLSGIDMDRLKDDLY